MDCIDLVEFIGPDYGGRNTFDMILTWVFFRSGHDEYEVLAHRI